MFAFVKDMIFVFFVNHPSVCSVSYYFRLLILKCGWLIATIFWNGFFSCILPSATLGIATTLFFMFISVPVVPGPAWLLWCPHLRAAGQPWKVWAHQLDGTGRRRLCHNLLCLVDATTYVVRSTDLNDGISTEKIQFVGSVLLFTVT